MPSRSPRIWPRALSRKNARPTTTSTPRASASSLAEAHAAHLGDRVDAVGQEARHALLVREAERAAHGHPCLLHRGRGERGESDHVARGVDARASPSGTPRRRRCSRGRRSPPRPPRGSGRRCSRATRRDQDLLARDRRRRISAGTRAARQARAAPPQPRRRGAARPRDASSPPAVAPPSRGRGRAAGVPRFSTRCTSTPSAANIEAYSQPMTPPPRTASEDGSRSIPRMSLESWTWGSSKGIAGGRKGCDPVAMSATSNESRAWTAVAPHLHRVGV